MKSSNALGAIAVAIAASFVGGAAFAADLGTQASVIAMNQKEKNDSVSITYAYAPQQATLKIFAQNPERSAVSKAIGEVSLSPGDHRDVAVKLNSIPKSGTRLWAVVEQGKGQKPFENLDGPAQQTFKVL
jgi:hypothetical protein